MYRSCLSNVNNILTKPPYSKDGLLLGVNLVFHNMVSLYFSCSSMSTGHVSTNSNPDTHESREPEFVISSLRRVTVKSNSVNAWNSPPLSTWKCHVKRREIVHVLSKVDCNVFVAISDNQTYWQGWCLNASRMTVV